MRTGGIEYYLFDTDGTRVGAPFPERDGPIEPDQVEAILAAAGSFARPTRPLTGEPRVLRARYDGYCLVGVRGHRRVLAAVYPDSREDPPLDDLLRMLRRFEERFPRRPPPEEPAERGPEPRKRLLPRRHGGRDEAGSE